MNLAGIILIDMNFQQGVSSAFFSDWLLFNIGVLLTASSKQLSIFGVKIYDYRQKLQNYVIDLKSKLER